MENTEADWGSGNVLVRQGKWPQFELSRGLGPSHELWSGFMGTLSGEGLVDDLQSKAGWAAVDSKLLFAGGLC